MPVMRINCLSHISDLTQIALQNVLQNTMTNNTHYFQNILTDTHSFLLNITYDDLNKVIVLETTSHVNFFNNTDYELPFSPKEDWHLTNYPNTVLN